MKSLFILTLTVVCFAACGPGTPPEKIVLMKTDAGDMKIKLFDDTPKHSENMLKLAKEGFYKDLIFHRVIKDFMIQGGDPDSRGAAQGKPLGQGGPGYQIPAEFKVGNFHFKGALAAARTPDSMNPQKESSGSQFYIVQGMAGNKITDDMLNQIETNRGFKYSPEDRAKYKKVGGFPMLDMEYTVYGMVMEGTDVIDKISNTPKARGDRPKTDIKILKVEVL